MAGDEPAATDWAYLAGLIDGEGCLVLHHKKNSGRAKPRTRPDNLYPFKSENSYQCVITISNTDTKMIDWVRDTFNAYVYFQREREGNRKTQYVVSWQAKESVCYILKGVIPYLLTKYEVAESMLHFTEVPQWEKEMRRIIYDEFKNIKEEVKYSGR